MDCLEESIFKLRSRFISSVSVLHHNLQWWATIGVLILLSVGIYYTASSMRSSIHVILYWCTSHVSVMTTHASLSCSVVVLGSVFNVVLGDVFGSKLRRLSKKMLGRGHTHVSIRRHDTCPTSHGSARAVVHLLGK